MWQRYCPEQIKSPGLRRRIHPLQLREEPGSSAWDVVSQYMQKVTKTLCVPFPSPRREAASESMATDILECVVNGRVFNFPWENISNSRALVTVVNPLKNRCFFQIALVSSRPEHTSAGPNRTPQFCFPYPQMPIPQLAVSSPWLNDPATAYSKSESPGRPLLPLHYWRSDEGFAHRTQMGSEILIMTYLGTCFWFAGRAQMVACKSDAQQVTRIALEQYKGEQSAPPPLSETHLLSCSYL